jgi:hypothetical protein
VRWRERIERGFLDDASRREGGRWRGIGEFF